MYQSSHILSLGGGAGGYAELRFVLQGDMKGKFRACANRTDKLICKGNFG